MTAHVIAHIDMDCFFAACEIKKDPSLKGKKLIVGGRKESRRGVVCTASYEARKDGVRSAMPISKALTLCPDAICIPTDHAFYAKESKKIMEVFQNITSSFQQVSIDEAYLDITEFVKIFDTWDRAGKYIQTLLQKKTGYSCSIGISESRKVSKIASDYKKPAGITVVTNPKEFLAPLPITKIPGVGKKTVTQYYALNIKTISDFANKSKFTILDHFGIHGYKLWELANGNDFSGIEYRADKKSISKENTFEYDITDKKIIATHLKKVIKNIYPSTQKYFYKTVSIKVRYKDFKTITRSHSFSVSTNTYDAIVSACEQLIEDIDYEKGIRLFGVRVENLSQITQKQATLQEFRVASC